jgi:4-phytase/acid phosphatase
MLARLLCALVLIAPYAWAQSVPNELKLVVVLTRHGVRSPLNSMANYSRDSWPSTKEWGVECCGDLTPRGAHLLTILGGYYRSYYKSLLPKTGCPAEQIYIWADNEERTLGTANALARGLAGNTLGCRIPVNSLRYTPSPCPTGCQRAASGNQTDLWFHPLPGICHKVSSGDKEKIQLVVNDINSGYDQLLAKYRPQLQSLQNTLGCCHGGVCGKVLRCTLFDLPHQATAGKVNEGSAVKWAGPFAVGSTVAEAFLLEYANGMPCKSVGWDRVVFSSPDCSGPGGNFRQMQEIHTAYFQQVNRPLIVAQIQGSNLANQILTLLQKEVSSPGEKSPKIVIFSGHDTNVANVAALLDLSWKLPDLPDNDTPPGGALVFELYSGASPGSYYVRAHYVHQTVQQLRDATLLSLDNPPHWAHLRLPGCAVDCPFGQFRDIMHAAIRLEFVTPKPTMQ